jgi:hypothetical protein
MLLTDEQIDDIYDRTQMVVPGDFHIQFARNILRAALASPPKGDERDAARWISVKDRLPELGQQHVLVWCTLWKDSGEIAIGIKWERSWDVEGSHVANSRVTHWMPLPAPPEAMKP